MGVERLLMECEAQEIEFKKPENVKVYFANLCDEAKPLIGKLCLDLRKAGIGCERDLVGRSFKAQMKYANKAGIPYLVVLGEDEVKNGKANVKNMADGSQEEVSLNEIVSFFEKK